jgi:hypothetical protein
VARAWVVGAHGATADLQATLLDADLAAAGAAHAAPAVEHVRDRAVDLRDARAQAGGVYVWSAPLTSATVRRVRGESVGAAVDSGPTLHGPGGVWKGWWTGGGECAVHGAVMLGPAWLDALVYIVSLILSL